MQQVASRTSTIAFFTWPLPFRKFHNLCFLFQTASKALRRIFLFSNKNKVRFFFFCCDELDGRPKKKIFIYASSYKVLNQLKLLNKYDFLKNHSNCHIYITQTLPRGSKAEVEVEGIPVFCQLKVLLVTSLVNFLSLYTTLRQANTKASISLLRLKHSWVPHQVEVVCAVVDDRGNSVSYGSGGANVLTHLAPCRHWERCRSAAARPPFRRLSAVSSGLVCLTLGYQYKLKSWILY